MKIAAIYSPYWETLGGGEKYAATIAKTCLEHHYEVRLLSKNSHLIENVKERFAIDLKNALVDPVGYHLMECSLWERFRYQQQLDVLFWVSDGSLPFLFARRNFLHFQVPFTHTSVHLITPFKRATYTAVICNSHFTQRFIDKTFSLRSRVLYPPASMIPAGKKQPLIISVGRFDNLMQNKRQDILITAFKKLQLPGWRLILAGGVLHGSQTVAALRQEIKNTSIEIITNPSFSDLAQLYAHATFYWHAAGYGVDTEKYPEKAEHFGITTVEAMSAGCVPLVYGAGGQLEIVKPWHNGVVWSHPEELIEATLKLIKDEPGRERIATQAMASSQQYNERNFKDAFSRYLG